jgi:hypothetical protein
MTETLQLDSLVFPDGPLPDLDLKNILSKSEKRVCWYYVPLLEKAAKDALNRGEVTSGHCYALLAGICHMEVNPRDRANPIGPRMSGGGNRTVAPEDLHPHHLDALVRILDQIEDPALRARVGDVIWIRKKDHKAARTALDAYVTQVEGLLSGPDWMSAILPLRRALQLAGILDRGGSIYGCVVKGFENHILSANEPAEKSLVAHIMAAMLEEGHVLRPAELSKRAEELAEKYADIEEHHHENFYWTLAAQFAQVAKDHERAKAMKRRLAQSFEQMAEEFQQGNSRPCMVGNSLQSAAKLYSDIGDSEKVQELIPRMKAAHIEEQKRLGRISIHFDPTELIEGGRSVVKDRPTMEALWALAFSLSWQSWENIEKQSIETRKDTPILALAPRVYMTPEGNISSQTGSLLSDDPKVKEEAHNSQVMEDYCQGLMLRGSTFLEAARDELASNAADLNLAVWALLVSNPWIPESRTPIIWRGMMAGLYGDPMLCIHFLVPQIEALVRWKMENAGRVVTSMKGNIQEEKGLSTLLDDAEAAKLLGEDLVWELKALLTDRPGLNLRNRIAHGLVGLEDFHIGLSNNLWWMVLKLAVVGRKLQVEETKTAREATNGNVPIA